MLFYSGWIRLWKWRRILPYFLIIQTHKCIRKSRISFGFALSVCLHLWQKEKNINMKQGASGNEKLNSYCERIGNFPGSLHQELINKIIVSNSRKIKFCQKSIMNSHLLVLIILTPPFHLQESGAPLQQHVLFIVVEGMNWKHCLTKLHTLNSIAIQIMFLQKCLPLR